MDFKIAKNDLMEAAMFGGIMSKKTTKGLEILNNSRFCIYKNQLVVSSTDTKTFVTKRVFLEDNIGDDKISFCVSTNDISKALSTLNDDFVKVSVKDGSIIIKHKKGKMKFPVLGDSEFPEIRKEEEVFSFEHDTSVFCEMLDIAKNFAANDILKPILNGVFIKAEGDTLTMCGTDGKIMYVDEAKLETHALEEVTSIIPSSVCQIVINMANKSERIKVSIHKRYVTFSVNNSRVSVCTIEGKYPNFKSVIPEKSSIFASFDTKVLSNTMRRLSLFSPDSSVINININDNICNFTAEDIDFSKKSSEEIEIPHEGCNIELGVKSNQMSMILNCISSKDVTIKMTEPTRPIIYEDKNKPNMVILQMPCII